MDHRTRRLLEARLAALDPAERRRLARDATRRRREEGTRRVDEHEMMLRLLYATWLEEQAEAPPDESALDPACLGLVMEVARGQVDVLLPPTGDLPERLVTCDLPGRLARVQKTAVAVGDRVQVLDPRVSPGGVAAVLPRRHVLSRPDPHNPNIERVLVANVDAVVAVCSIVRPDLRPGLVDRLLVAIHRGGARPVVAVTKVDLVDGPLPHAEALEGWRQAGVAVHLVSAETGQGLEGLRSELGQGVCALVGHSGVGKSSLVTALGGQARVGLVRDHDGRGRHTTTAATLHDLGDGLRVIDTPGVRSFGMWRLRPQDLADAFPEVEALAAACRYRGCAHGVEDGCAVREAALDGRLALPRYQSWRRLQEELAGDPD